jgi:hypothetical protein
MAAAPLGAADAVAADDDMKDSLIRQRQEQIAEEIGVFMVNHCITAGGACRQTKVDLLLRIPFAVHHRHTYTMWLRDRENKQVSGQRISACYHTVHHEALLNRQHFPSAARDTTELST